MNFALDPRRRGTFGIINGASPAILRFAFVLFADAFVVIFRPVAKRNVSFLVSIALVLLLFSRIKNRRLANTDNRTKHV